MTEDNILMEEAKAHAELLAMYNELRKEVNDIKTVQSNQGTLITKLSERYDNLDEKLNEVKDNQKSLEKKIDNLSAKLDDKFTKLDHALTALDSKPDKAKSAFIDKIVIYLATGGLGALITYLFALL